MSGRQNNGTGPGLCNRAKNHRHWLKEETFLPSPLTESQLAILRVPLTPYRPRATGAAMNGIVAAAAGAAKGQFPSFVT